MFLRHAVRQVIFSIVSREHHSTVITHRVAGIAGIVSHSERVVVGFGSNEKDAIISHVDNTIRPRLNETPQLVTSTRLLCQLIQQVVAKPVVASTVVESDFKFRPRTIEEVGSVDVMLNQQRNAIRCKTEAII